LFAGVEMAAKRRSKEGGEPSGESARKVRASECQRMMRQTLAAEYGEILGAFVRVAKKGSAAHMKLATELLEKRDAKGKKRGGSAARLLRELEERER
jgi:hypothetical protein